MDPSDKTMDNELQVYDAWCTTVFEMIYNNDGKSENLPLFQL